MIKKTKTFIENFGQMGMVKRVECFFQDVLAELKGFYEGCK